MQHQSQSQRQVQTQKILPQQIQFLNMLHLNQHELDDLLQKELDENPFLDDQREDSEPTAAEPDFAPDAPLDDAEPLPTEGDFEDPMNWGSLDDDAPDYQSHTEHGFDADDEKWQAPAVQGTTIREEIKEQCHFLNLSDRQTLLVEYLVDSLDDSGYLRTPLETIVDDISFSQNIFISDTEIADALRLLQTFEPAGIAARDLRECLLLQIERLENRGAADLALPRILIEKYMDALAAHRYENLRAELEISAEQLREALDRITHLKPRPLQGLGEPSFAGGAAAANAEIITPEYLVETDGADFIVSLPSGRADAIRLLPDSEATVRRSSRDKKALRFVQKKLEDARWLVEALRQRDETMLRTMRTIVILQRDFFQTGDFLKLKPMTLRDVAAFVDADQSTISRVTSSKFVQTPFGIFSVKELFTQTFTAQDGRELSNSEVMDWLKKLVDEEDKTEPLNDSRLCEMLAERGFPVARRTVAKYRDWLQIPVADLRRSVGLN